MNEPVIQMFPAETLPEMTELQRWGIEVIKTIQGFESPALTAFMRFFSGLGAGSLYIIVILFAFWAVNEKKAFRFGLFMIISVWINALLKDLFGQPRPFNLDPSIGLAFESGYGFPSGHAQLSLCFFIPAAVYCAFTLAAKTEKPLKKIIWTIAISFILLISLSRIYLGLHFPTDILAGWVFGVLLLVVFFYASPFLEKLFLAGGARAQNISAAIIAFLMNAVYPQGLSLSALFLGFCVGYTVMQKNFPFSAQAELNEKKPGLPIITIRCLTGFLGLALIFMILRLLLPGEGSLFADFIVWGSDSPYNDLGLFLRYGLLGFWITAGAPKIFQQMRLSV